MYWLYPSILTGDVPPYFILALPKVYFTNFSILPIPLLVSEILLYAGICISQMGSAFFFYVRAFLIVFRYLNIPPTARLFFHFFAFHNASKAGTLISCNSRATSLFHSNQAEPECVYIY